MSDSAVLEPIGKGQYTIPHSWRKKLGFDKKKVIAELHDEMIIIRSAAQETEWDIENISLNTLSEEDKKIIEEGRDAYKKGKKEEFLEFDEIFA